VGEGQRSRISTINWKDVCPKTKKRGGGRQTKSKLCGKEKTRGGNPIRYSPLGTEEKSTKRRVGREPHTNVSSKYTQKAEGPHRYAGGNRFEKTEEANFTSGKCIDTPRKKFKKL